MHTNKISRNINNQLNDYSKTSFLNSIQEKSFIFKNKPFSQVPDVVIDNLKSNDKELLLDVIQNISHRLQLFFTNDVNKYEVDEILKFIENNKVCFNLHSKTIFKYTIENIVTSLKNYNLIYFDSIK